MPLNRKLVVEAIGTFFLVFTVGMAVGRAGVLAPIAILPEQVGIALMIALAVAGAVATVRLLHLPWWWLLFPPFIDAAWNGNPQNLLVPLILLGRSAQTLDRLRSLDQSLFGEREVLPIVRREQVQPERDGVVALDDLRDSGEIAERVRLLFALRRGHQSDVRPVLGEWEAGKGLALSDLVLVVGEDQVATAAVDVDLVT